ncbi:MAG: 2-C-methyl-D-erythritol 2,4-cyclodiphosphate synthase [Chloroflexi bacterium]|nr:2-C-methyl-D-erythritol 2,4-cyclodiphosphate synthase [Chloroflexota bacterium]|tara:strand:- start:966 stop:2162 length:1197 start_codon:yes stop_codon:yes gene_type:complete
MVQMKQTILDVVILSAGKSSRMDGIDKQLVEIDGKKVINYSIELFSQFKETRSITIMVSEKNVIEVKKIVKSLVSDKEIYILIGGTLRQDTVKIALRNLSSIYNSKDIVAIHDGARPLVNKTIVINGLKSAQVSGAAIPIIPLSDTIKKVSNNLIIKTYDRSKLAAVQTPQFFKFDVLSTSYELLNNVITDDASAVESSGGLVSSFPGSLDNIKITNPIDLKIANSILNKKQKFNNINSNLSRYGTGFDCHKLVDGGPLVLGGLKIPFEKELAGHSDGDVLLHAIASSLLGAGNLGDLGSNFPSNQKKYKNISSEFFVSKSKKLLKENGWEILYIDTTIIAEKPRLSEFAEQIIDNLSKILYLQRDSINLKITSTDSVGFIGKSEGIAAQSIATVAKI